jgi:hypothetical protein
MPQRAVAVALVLAAALADVGGAHVVAFYALVAAVPFAAAASLASFGGLLEGRDDPVAALQTLLWALCLFLVVAGCAARSAALETGGLPAFAQSTLSAALVLLAVKAVVAGWTVARVRLARVLEPRSIPLR